MTAVVTDYNDDGWPDIYVACDSTASILYRNNRDGTFTDVALEAGAAYNEDGQAQAGMGVTTGDYDGDGRVDIFKTHFADDLPALYRNTARGFFEDASRAAGFDITRHVQWGTGLVDFDNDGYFKEYPHRGPRLVYQNLGHGRFKDVSAGAGPGVLLPRSSRGSAYGDFDNDGDVDVLVMNMNEPPLLLRNDGGNARNWVKVKLVGTKSNRTAVGARVRLKAGPWWQTQEVTSQSSYYSHNDLRLHFGLGANARAELIEVRWPGGEVETIRDVSANQFVMIKEGSGVVKVSR
jgi:hypothetical protein